MLANLENLGSILRTYASLGYKIEGSGVTRPEEAKVLYYTLLKALENPYVSLGSGLAVIVTHPVEIYVPDLWKISLFLDSVNPVESEVIFSIRKTENTKPIIQKLAQVIRENAKIIGKLPTLNYRWLEELWLVFKPRSSILQTEGVYSYPRKGVFIPLNKNWKELVTVIKPIFEKHGLQLPIVFLEPMLEAVSII